MGMYMYTCMYRVSREFLGKKGRGSGLSKIEEPTSGGVGQSHCPPCPPFWSRVVHDCICTMWLSQGGGYVYVHVCYGKMCTKTILVCCHKAWQVESEVVPGDQLGHVVVLSSHELSCELHIP